MKKVIIIISVIAVLLFGVVIYTFARRSKAVPKDCKDQIPNNWNASPIAISLHDTMSGIGTDETRFFTIMDTLNKCQIAIMYNRYLELFDNSIIDDIQSDFSGDQLQRALGYFNGIDGIELRLTVAKASRFIRGGGGGRF